MKVAVPLAKNIFAPLATIASASEIDVVIQRKMRGRGVVRVPKRITLVISNEHMDDFIKIIKSLKNSRILIDEVSETLKHEIKNKKVDFLSCY